MCAFRSYLDMVKLFVFSYFFWLVLCLIFITGTTRINIFCLGYLVACFYFMLFGGTLLLQPVQYVLRLWDCLIAYTCVVISLKNMLSVSTSLSVFCHALWHHTVNKRGRKTSPYCATQTGKFRHFYHLKAISTRSTQKDSEI